MNAQVCTDTCTLSCGNTQTYALCKYTYVIVYTPRYARSHTYSFAKMQKNTHIQCKRTYIHIRILSRNRVRIHTSNVYIHLYTYASIHTYTTIHTYPHLHMPEHARIHSENCMYTHIPAYTPCAVYMDTCTGMQGYKCAVYSVYGYVRAVCSAVIRKHTCSVRDKYIHSRRVCVRVCVRMYICACVWCLWCVCAVYRVTYVQCVGTYIHVPSHLCIHNYAKVRTP